MSPIDWSKFRKTVRVRLKESTKLILSYEIVRFCKFYSSIILLCLNKIPKLIIAENETVNQLKFKLKVIKKPPIIS